MSIKRYTASKDNTISNAFKANLTGRGTTGNMGSSDILEVFSIYGQASSSSLEQSRMLVEVPVSEISKNRSSGELPESGSVTFKYKMFNAAHGQTTPEKFSVIATPLIRSWSEGTGLDMEEFSDLGSSNWTSASLGKLWATEGGDVALTSSINLPPVDLNYIQYFDAGFENLELDITGLVEEWVKGNDLTATAATASIVFHEKPAQNCKIQIYAHDGDYRIFQVSNITGSSGKTVFFETGSTAVTSSLNFAAAVNTYLGTSIAATTQGPDQNEVTASLTQNMTGFFGNTNISASVLTMPAATASILGFAGGTGAQPYGLMLRLSGSAESGAAKTSYYTKKFFARSSHHHFKRPIIEAQWAPTILDDRSRVLRSSSLAPPAENLNNIYLYNRRRNGFVDIPNTGSTLIVQLYPSLTSSAITLSTAGGVAAHSPAFITASRTSKGMYKAQFTYPGTGSSLIDVWSRHNTDGTYDQLYTGSTFKVTDENSFSHYEVPSYVTNITNLKSSYTSQEVATFRIYTRDKSWSPNIYTKASSQAPITIIQDGYYKIRRVSDDQEVVSYSTSSTPSYSSLSYDASGSFFDLDMSILEPNYLYEINLLYRDGTDYIEQKEKFKFRVNP
jgi:hypothetical protein